MNKEINIEESETRLLSVSDAVENPRPRTDQPHASTRSDGPGVSPAPSSSTGAVHSTSQSRSQRRRNDTASSAAHPRQTASASGLGQGVASRSGAFPEAEASSAAGSSRDTGSSSYPGPRGAGRPEHRQQALGIMDTIGREIAVIVAPVSVCMLMVVYLVLTLTPNGSSEGGIMPAVGSLVYQEKSTDTDMEKLGGGLLNALAFVGMVAVLTFGLVGLFWLRCTKCLWGYMGFSGFTILACLGGYVAVQLVKVLSIPVDVFSFLFIVYNSSVVGVLAVFFMRMPIFLTQCYLVVIAAVVAFWFTHLPEWTTWLILVAMAIYDIVAVLAPGGPLKLLLEIAMEREEDLPALVYEARPPPHAPLTPPPELSTSPPAVLVAGDRAEPRRLVGRFERRAPAGGASALSPSTVKMTGHQSIASVVSEGSTMYDRDRVRQASLSADKLMQSRRERPGRSGAGAFNSDSASPMRSLSERSQSFPQGTRRDDSPGNRKTQLYLERLEVPVDEQGTAVVVSRQRSPVRRHVSRKPDFASGSEPQGSSRGASELPTPQQSFNLFSDMRPQPHLPPGPVRVLPTEIEDCRDLEEDVQGGPSSVPEFVLPGAIKLGLGDFIFYSIMAGRAAMYDMMTVYACYLAIIAGLGATLVLLAVTRRALPALPFSICLGVIFYLLTRVLLEPFVIVLLTSLLYF